MTLVVEKDPRPAVPVLRWVDAVFPAVRDHPGITGVAEHFVDHGGRPQFGRRRLDAEVIEFGSDAVRGFPGQEVVEDAHDDPSLLGDDLALVRSLADPAVGDAALDLAVLGAGQVHAGDAARGVLGGLQRHHAHHAGHVSVAVVDQVHPSAGRTDGRPLDVFDDIDQVFQVPGLADEPVQVVEDDAVDHSGREVG